jgi:hypothetical protein
MLPIGTDGDRPNTIRVSSQRRNLLPARHRPHLHQVVITSRKNILPVGTEGDRQNRTRMSSQGRNLLPARYRPHLQQGVSTSRNDMLPIWTEGDRPNIIRVSSLRRNLTDDDIASWERELGVQVYGQCVADMMPELGSESELEDEGEDDE